MKTRITAVLLGATLAGLTRIAAADQPVDVGMQEFMAKCAVCHGDKGKGDGIDLVQRPPANLTTLTQRNNGIFPMARVYNAIDGRGVPSHGTRDMPVWGREYGIEAANYYMDSFDYDADKFVRDRILMLIDYIYRIQE